MARHLFAVSDTFLIRGRGLVLVSGIVPVGDERFGVGDTLLLKRPDGSRARAVIGGLEMFTCTTKPDMPVLLNGFATQDVPLLTEDWSVDRSDVDG
jgi:hypothetical protein